MVQGPRNGIGHGFGNGTGTPRRCHTDLDAFLSDAKQMARVKVDEEGVEAAAVTILEISTCALPEEVCVMDLDRPFLFVIRTQDIPLFVGVVNQVRQ